MFAFFRLLSAKKKISGEVAESSSQQLTAYGLWLTAYGCPKMPPP
jgi:hypothetical protein